MRYYLHRPNQEKDGPFTLPELLTLDRRETFESGTQVSQSQSSILIPWEQLRTEVRKSEPVEEPEPSPAPPQAAKPSRPSNTGLHVFVWPFTEVHRLGDLNNRSLLALTGVGLIPMVLFTLFSGLFETNFVYFLTALYFSVLWAILFYHVFPAPNIRISTSILCFMGTGLVSISLLVAFFQLPYISLPASWINSDLPAARAAAFFVWVAFPEELCKVLMIYVLSKRSVTFLPRTMAYYGMISGLGFGIHEGLDYQLDRNISFAESQAEYLFLNLLRLTSLPVLHAVWTGIAAYFLGFAYLYRHRLVSLTLIGLTIPSVLHALFNTFNGTLTSLGISLMSLLLLILYLSKHDAFDIFLGRDQYLRSRAKPSHS